MSFPRNNSMGMNIPISSIEESNSIWNMKIEKSVQSLAELCLGYKWMHCELAKEKSLMYNRLMYCSIFFAPMAGVLNTINSYLQDHFTIPIIVTIVSFMTGILISIIKFGNYEAQINKYKTTAGRYTSLANNARVQLNLDREDREDAKQYVIWFTTSYSDLFDESPIIPEYVMTRYRKHAEKYNFKIPGEVGILIDESVHQNREQELQEMYQKNVKMLKNEAKKEAKNDVVRLDMFSLNNYSMKNFKKSDLARFNNIMMKRQMKTPRSNVSSTNNSRIHSVDNSQRSMIDTSRETSREKQNEIFDSFREVVENENKTGSAKNKYSWKDNFPDIEEEQDIHSMV